MPSIDKVTLVRAVLDKLEQELLVLAAAAEATRQGATHEESKPENDKDTRGLEASYLARGQAKRVEETEEIIMRLRFLSPRDFTKTDPIDLGALVEVDIDGESQTLFIVPMGGGMAVKVRGVDVRLVTPASPVGQALMGKLAGEGFELRSKDRLREYEIVAVR
jgi:transcription elongation GreA/GreB family factor